ncbi:hypothetical protein DFA_08536 [Cavenderia fasciculata]|uniref:Uncharacterized protein n=1 Tax=Cavenderia fasciculata TaxID=261658 RepID=F4Q2X6_CACFS|nr:uncharacterized protein DFA_08536 [Cavenderia fasciculata]EGG17540.1 hypothetical protein DFA_08536 [Cavenderia fasciculata]|eukprot:XP_004356024.1 hypothetical protein DFA_08536 [Cavenderia fasciculata]
MKNNGEIKTTTTTTTINTVLNRHTCNGTGS